nr:phage transcriptional regulator [Arsenophonus nasoniae]
MMRLPDNIGLVGLAGLAQKQSAEYVSKRFQPLGVMPLLSSSLRIMRFIHPARLSSPSFFCASSIAARSSGSNRNWKTGLPRLSFLCIDMSITPVVMCLCVTTRYYHIEQKTTPYSASTLAGRLTTMLTGVTVMASYKSTQTRPKFTDTYWIIPLDSNIPYGKVSLTRRERRLFHVLFKGDRLVWSGLKPVQEVAYV